MQILPPVKYGPPPMASATSLPVPKYGMPIPTDVIVPGGIPTGTLLALAGVIVLVAIGAWVGFRLLLGQKAGKK
jgi:hypothetical protein